MQLKGAAEAKFTWAVVMGTAPGWSMKNCLSSRRSVSHYKSKNGKRLTLSWENYESSLSWDFLEIGIATTDFISFCFSGVYLKNNEEMPFTYCPKKTTKLVVLNLNWKLWFWSFRKDNSMRKSLYLTLSHIIVALVQNV